MKYIKDLINDNLNITQVKEQLKLNKNISIVESIILGTPSIIIRQNHKVENTDSIYNDYDFIVLSNKLDLITMSMPKMVDTSSIYSTIEYKLKDEIQNLLLEEWIDGNYVIVTKYNNTIMVSTKINLYGTNIIPGTNDSYYNCLVSKFENNSPYDLDILFDKETKDYIWIFNITNNKEIYLITAYDRISLMELSKEKLLMYTGKFKLKMPKFSHIINNKDVSKIKNNFYRFNNAIKGLVYNNIITGYREKESLNIINQYIYANSKNILYKITNLIIEDKIDIAKQTFEKYTELIELLDFTFKNQYNQTEKLFNIIKKFKTKKQIANCLKEFKFYSFLFDNYSLPIINFKNFGEYYKSKKILSLHYNKQEIDNLLNKYIIPTLKELKINEQ